MKRKISSLIAVTAVIAMVGAYSILGETTTPPSGGAASIGIPVPLSGIAFAATIPTTSGIENIYIMEHKADSYDNADNLAGHENILEYSGTDAIIENSGGSANIPYDNAFDIVISIKVDSENVAYLQEENVRIELTLSGAFSLGPENSANENEFTRFTEGSENLFMNIIWDNNGNGYTLSAGATLNIDNVKLYLWA